MWFLVLVDLNDTMGEKMMALLVRCGRVEWEKVSDQSVAVVVVVAAAAAAAAYPLVVFACFAAAWKNEKDHREDQVRNLTSRFVSVAETLDDEKGEWRKDIDEYASVIEEDVSRSRDWYGMC